MVLLLLLLFHLSILVYVMILNKIIDEKSSQRMNLKKNKLCRSVLGSSARQGLSDPTRRAGIETTRRQIVKLVWKGPRTVLMKMTREKFQRKRYFFYEKDSRFNPRLIHKSSFLIGQVPIEKYGLKTLFLLFNIQKIENVLLKCSPPPRDQTNPLAYSCSFTFHTSYKNGMIGHGGKRCRNAQKHYFIKTYWKLIL